MHTKTINKYLKTYTLKTKFLTLLITTIFICNKSYSQFAFNNITPKLKNPPSTSYKIIQTEKGTLKKVLEFDKEGQIIFDYRETGIPPYFNWKEPHRFIYANEYDSIGRIVKRYNFNSNAGLSIYQYEYGQNPSTKTIYTQEYTDSQEPERNSNPYAYISQIKNFEGLKKSEEVANILLSEKIEGSTEILNMDNKPVEIREYSGIYRDTIITSIEYNTNGERVLKRVVGLSNNETKRETTTKHEQNSEITEIIYFKNGKRSSNYQFANSINQSENTETEYSESNGILNIRHSIYDEDEYLIKVLVLETDYNGNLIIPIDSNLRKTAQMLYQYNQEGLLVKEIMTNYKTGKKDTRKYKYQIEVNKI